MEENVALDSNKQKQFVKSIKGIKKLLKKDRDDGPKVLAPPLEDAKAKKRKIKQRGLVYLSHIPHGFYEHQMTQYFRQFGRVTNARVIRSKRTGRSKGCAFVEFSEPAVAQIVAETMNNYLMGKRLIKAAYIPPEKQRQHAMRKLWTTENNPGHELRQKLKQKHNENKSAEGDLKKARKLLSNINRTKEKLKDLGIDYSFQPVDVPEPLLEIPAKVNKSNEKVKKEKPTNTLVKNKKKQEIPAAQVKIGMAKKQEKLNKSKVKAIENFIKINKSETEDDDSSVDFDSDEFEKAMEVEDEFESGSEHSGSDDEGDDDPSEEASGTEESDESEEEPPVPSKATKKAVNIQKTKPQKKQNKIVAPQQKTEVPEKRKTFTNASNVAKKAKFEKRGKQGKQFKKK